MKKTMFTILLFSFLYTLPAQETRSPAANREELIHQQQTTEEPVVVAEEAVTTHHRIMLAHEPLEYTAHAGTLSIKGNSDTDVATIFYTYYQKKTPNQHARPLAICFNGGPGSSSIWLHIGMLGPKRIVLKELQYNPSPGRYTTNKETLLNTADLLFIDPVSTGFSKADNTQNEKEFFSVNADAKSIAQFLQTFLTRYKKWNAPLFLIGESYGAIRAIELATQLKENYYIDVNGITLISPATNLQMIFPEVGNDYPYIAGLPTIAATAHFYHLLPEEQQKKKLQELLAEVEEFSIHTYATALLLGDKIEKKQKQELLDKLTMYTGIPQETFVRYNLRLASSVVAAELLRNRNQIVGSYDTRYNQFYPLTGQIPYEYPCFNAIASAFHTAFEQYLTNELHWKKNEPYIVLNYNTNSAWNWITGKYRPGFGYFHSSDILETLLTNNADLKVLCACGYYDAVTPYFANDIIIDHLRLPEPVRQRIEQHYYDGGHMMYINESCLKHLNEAIKALITNG